MVNFYHFAFHFCNIRAGWEKKGLAEGMEKGLEAGRAEGIEKAFEEKTSAARKMKEDGLPVETICKYTGLTLEQVTEL